MFREVGWDVVDNQQIHRLSDRAIARARRGLAPEFETCRTTNSACTRSVWFSGRPKIGDLGYAHKKAAWNADGLRIGDDAVRASTGKSWKEWYAALDVAGAEPNHRGNRRLAGGEARRFRRLVASDGGGLLYEQARGLRAPHEKRAASRSASAEPPPTRSSISSPPGAMRARGSSGFSDAAFAIRRSTAGEVASVHVDGKSGRCQCRVLPPRARGSAGRRAACEAPVGGCRQEDEGLLARRSKHLKERIEDRLGRGGDRVSMNDDEIRDAIRRRYAAVAAQPRAIHVSGRPEARSGSAIAPTSWIASLRTRSGISWESAIRSPSGSRSRVGASWTWVVEAASTVRSRRTTSGRQGRVIGVDMSPEMLVVAGRARDRRFAECRTRRGAGRGPSGCGWADLVISNGVLNLAACKEPVYAEIARVLRPEGRIPGGGSDPDQGSARKRPAPTSSLGPAESAERCR